ncbi:MAG: long-chain fatty acid transporter [Thiobacillus sp. SCN 64-35]|nr:MAG: long-chain fatty acid transporter [Thiobacillus sp. SCN 64-35]
MKFTRVFAFMALAGLAGSAFATDGYFSHGYGMKAKGMGGAATAMSDDAFGGANNPASMAFVGNRLDLGVDLFSPRRKASYEMGGTTIVSSDSNSDYFLIPEFGYSHMVNTDLALGVTAYGNGGMNTNYSEIAPGTNLLGGSGKLGVNLMQLIIAPTAAYKIAPNHSIGISPLIGYQQFKAYGLQAFSGFSSDPANFTNRGNDDSWGYGVRIGYMGKLTPTVSIGAAYASKMKFNEFSKYAGLFAEQGGFDIPENYNLGVAWQATPTFLVALDYQRINYSGVNSVGNPSTNMALFGANDGPGFGWQDIDVWKLGVEYKYSQQMTLRAGYNHTDNPIQSRDAFLNILAPGVIKDHATLGVTYTLASGNELTMAYMHAFKNDVTGPAAGGVDANIQMYQDSLGIAYSWKM